MVKLYFNLQKFTTLKNKIYPDCLPKKTLIIKVDFKLKKNSE